MILKLIRLIALTMLLPISAQLSAGEASNENILAILSAKMGKMESQLADMTKRQSQGLFTVFQDADFPGGDIAGAIGFPSESTELCLSECLKRDHCLAFTYIPGTQQCFLKKEIYRSQPEKFGGKVTGVMTSVLLEKMTKTLESIPETITFQSGSFVRYEGQTGTECIFGNPLNSNLCSCQSGSQEIAPLVGCGNPKGCNRNYYCQKTLKLKN